MVRFLVFSDLHYDDVEDGDRRIGEILEKARLRQPEFIVSLGDLCRPKQENQKILDRFRALGIPFYHTIGNHETNYCTFDEIKSFFSLSSPYYSVIHGEYKLIFLNTCYLREGSEEKAYYARNFKKVSCIHPVVPANELNWLREELRDGRKYIIFSHHSLINDFAKRGVSNRADIRELFQGKNVLLCLNGHDHGDSLTSVNGVSYFTVNSANYAWLGSQIAGSETLQKQYGYLKGMLQYEQAMCAYIEIHDDEILIQGENGAYLSVTPDDIGLHDYQWNGVSIKPQIRSCCLRLEK